MQQRPDEASRGGALQTTVLIARREFITRVRSRIFIVGTIVLMALLAGYITLQALVISKSVTTLKVGFAGESQVLSQPLKTAASSDTLKIQTRTVTDVSTGEVLVRAGIIDILVSGDAAMPNVEVKDQLDSAVEATLDGLAKEVALNRALTASGADPAAIEAKVASAAITVKFLDPNAALRTQRDVIGIFVAALLYVALVIYGQLVAAGVVEEKANRIIEILLSTVRARQLLFGKVVGIGLVGLAQLVLLGAVAIVAVTRTQAISVPSLTVEAVAGGLMWFVLGFTFFALIFAAAGSLVSRQEDLGAVTTPVSMLILGAYLAFFWVIANPDNSVAVVLSIIPPFAPILMPARMATGDAQAWQVLVAVVLTLGAIAAMNALAARIYTNSVLRIGSRVKILEAWRNQG